MNSILIGISSLASAVLLGYAFVLFIAWVKIFDSVKGTDDPDKKAILKRIIILAVLGIIASVISGKLQDARDAERKKVETHQKINF